MSVTDEIKERLNIVDIVEGYGVQLRKSGRNYLGYCPFHHNTRTPAFAVSEERQTWRCFGACADGGDVFSFVMRKEGWDFREALSNLAQQAGVELRQQSRQEAPADERLQDLLRDAAEYFHQLLYHAPQAEQARQYVRSRQLTRGSVNNFKLGYALDSFDALRDHFTSQGFSRQELIDVGLLTVNEERGSVYDRFRDRLIFPICDSSGQVAGFGARALDSDSIPKYLNSPQSELFDKSALLYGLHLAKRDIRRARQVVIVEGYMDVIRAHQAGFRNVVAQMGTALTEAQLTLLKRFSQRLIIALDADEAGVAATMRSLEVARDALDREVEARFDARGLLRHEARLKADVRIASLPPGQDPDDIIREDASQWVEVLQQAQPIVVYVIEQLTANVDLDDPKEKVNIANTIVPLIEDVASEVERNHYYQLLAKTLDVDSDNLRRMRPAARSSRRVEETPARRYGSLKLNYKMVAPRDIEQIEENFLKEALRQPSIMVQVDRLLQAAQQPIVDKHDFSQSLDQAVWRELRQRAVKIATGQVVTIEQLCETVDDSLRARIESLLQLPVTPISQREQLAQRLTRSILDLRYNKIRRLLAEVKQLLAEANRIGDKQAGEEHALKCQELSLRLYSIDRAKGSTSVGFGGTH